MNTSESLIFKHVENLIGVERFQLQQKIHIAVVGLGGVGSWAAEVLVRSGIGSITLIDADEICSSNINRQIHAHTNTVGKIKVEVLKERLKLINPALNIFTHIDFITEKNLHLLSSEPRPWGIIDAIDRVTHKCTLLNFAYLEKIPIVTVGGASGKENPKNIQVKDLMKTTNDPLLWQTRKKLRQEFAFPRKSTVGIKAVFCNEEVLPINRNEPSSSITNNFTSNENVTNKINNCEGPMGNSVLLTSTMGILAGYEMLEILNPKKNKTP